MPVAMCCGMVRHALSTALGGTEDSGEGVFTAVVVPAGSCTLRPKIFASRTAFLNTGGMCSPEGEMIWEKSDDGESDRYTLCFAPSDRKTQWGPSGSKLQCDPNSVFMVKASQYCCHNPRKVGGEPAKHEVCGDLKSEFDQTTQMIKIVEGPDTSGTEAQLKSVFDSPDVSPRAPTQKVFDDMKEVNKWKPVATTTCGGDAGKGEMVDFVGSTPHKFEFCPVSTNPVRGKKFDSYLCDGAYQNQHKLQCCTVDGHLHCVGHLTDLTASMTEAGATPACSCRDVWNVNWLTDTEKQIEKKAVMPLLPAYFSPTNSPEASVRGWRGGGRGRNGGRRGERFL